MQPITTPTFRSTSVERIVNRAALVTASGDDLFVRCSVPLDETVNAWAIGTDVAWFLASRRRHGAGWLTVAADAQVAPSLVSVAAEELGAGLSGVTVPAAALPALPDRLRPVEYNLWDWFFTADDRRSSRVRKLWRGPCRTTSRGSSR